MTRQAIKETADVKRTCRAMHAHVRTWWADPGIRLMAHTQESFVGAWRGREENTDKRTEYLWKVEPEKG